MVSRRHITSMKNTEEKLKQHKRAGEELFPMLMKQSRKSVVPRPGNLGSGTVSGSSSSQSGRGLHSGSHSQDEVPGGKEPEALQGLEPIGRSITVALVNSGLPV